MKNHALGYAAVVDSPIGLLGIRQAQGRLQGLDFLLDTEVPRSDPIDAVSCQAAAQLEAYFKNSALSMEVKLLLQGSAFQKQVWSALQQIPSGCTRTYGQLAAQLGSGARAVANACRRNPWPLIVPCHRVLAANGLGGFGGQRSGPMLAIKVWLLRHEGLDPEWIEFPHSG